jgi:hypothetical protein
MVIWTTRGGEQVRYVSSMHSLALLALCLLVWFPTVGYAQSEQAPPPPPDAPTLPPLVTAPDKPEEAPEAAPEAEIIHREYGSAKAPADLMVPRLVLSPVLGGVATAGGVVLGVVFSVGVLGCDIFEDGCSDGEFYIPTLVGGWAAGSLTVYGMSSFLNGQGSLGPTLLGGALGMGLGIAFLAASQGSAWFIAPLIPGFGAAIGYELSDYFARSGTEPQRDEFAGVQFTPVLGMTPRGGVLGGLMGRF